MTRYTIIQRCSTGWSFGPPTPRSPWQYTYQLLYVIRTSMNFPILPLVSGQLSETPLSNIIFALLLWTTLWDLPLYSIYGDKTLINCKLILYIAKKVWLELHILHCFPWENRTSYTPEPPGDSRMNSCNSIRYKNVDELSNL